MNPDLALAQVTTMRIWAEEWERQALADPVIHTGYGEVAFLLRKAADAAVKAVAPSIKHDLMPRSTAPEVFADHGIKPTPHTDTVREDEEADG